MDPRRNERGVGGRTPAQAPAPRGASLEPQGPASSQRRSPAAIGEALDGVDRDIRQLRIEFEKFFNGGTHVPPEELRTRVQGSIRSLRNLNFTSAVENFRLADLEARFNSYNELFNRRLRDQEEGRHTGPRPVPVAPAVPAFDAERGVVVGARMDGDAVQALYESLAKGPGDGPRFDLESFKTYLSKQVAAIQQKTGCAEVQFRVAAEDGRLKLKARPL